MISHRYKCIFIHIAKCAGTSVENAFGVDTTNYKAEENNQLFGWDRENCVWLQHATPQQLFDLNLISTKIWNDYYKIIIYRNSWSRAYSDYLWMLKARNTTDSFSNYLNRSGNFRKILNEKGKSYYVGDHLRLQKDYFFLNDERINYDCEIDFDRIESGFSKVVMDLSLPKNFFKKKLNQAGKEQKPHYSYFYNLRKRNLVVKKYKEDIEFFGFTFEERKNIFQRLKANLQIEKPASPRNPFSSFRKTKSF